jgi:hypothetical protein
MRQKKQERRAAKRKEKKHIQVREQSAGLPERLSAAVKFPVLHCWISDSVQTNGMGAVVLSRELPGGQVAVASFLVDRFCLGVKDAFGQILGRATYNTRYREKLRGQMSAREVAPADARRLVEDAVAYARSIGIAPHPDYAIARLLFGDIDPAQSTATFQFGKDGKPLFMPGPHDTPDRCRQIMAILTNTCGPDGFHYLLPMAGPDLSGVLRHPTSGRELESVEPDEDEEAPEVH